MSRVRAVVTTIVASFYADGDDHWKTLSPREREVATALAAGGRNREIATQLGISIKTVDTHRMKALGKLGCRNNADLANYVVARTLALAAGEDANALAATPGMATP